MRLHSKLYNKLEIILKAKTDREVYKDTNIQREFEKLREKEREREREGGEWGREREK